MRRFLHLAFPILLLSATANGQNENKTWYFGQNAGMDFNSGAPVALTNGSLNTSADNTAAISDASGNILFYSEGTTVWNSQHIVMSNGTGLLGHQSGGQPATIVPHPGNPNLYYLFTVGRLVLSGKQAQSPFMLDLRNQPDGAYLLKLSGEENYRIHRLVIAR